MHKTPEISEAEWRVVKLLWAKSPQPAYNLIQALAGTEGWHASTVKTILHRLCRRKALGKTPYKNLFLYQPLVTEEECVRTESDSFLNRFFGGSIKPRKERTRMTTYDLAELSWVWVWRASWQASVLVLLLSVHWFNPILGWAFTRMRADRELACDAAALACARPGESFADGETLLRLLGDLGRPALGPGRVGILEDKRQIHERVRRIAGFTRATPVLALAAILLLLLAVFALTEARRKSLATQGRETAEAPVLGTDAARGALFRQMGWLDDSSAQWAESPRVLSSKAIVRELGVRSVPFLIQQLRAPDPDTPTAVDRRRKAVWALGELAPEATNALPALIESLRDTGTRTVPGPGLNPRMSLHAESVCSLAATALGKYGAAARPAVPALREAMKRGVPTAISALVRIDPEAPELLDDLVEATGTHHFLSDGGNDYRLTAMLGLAKLGERREEAILALLPMARDPNYCESAMRLLLANTPFKDAIARAIEADLREADGVDAGRMAAGWVCAGNRSAALLPTLLAALNEEPRWYSQPLLKALAAFGEEARAAIPSLTNALSSRGCPYRADLLETLAQVGKSDSAAAGAVLAFMKHSDPDLRATAFRTVVRFTPIPTEARRIILDASQDPVLSVREAAIECFHPAGLDRGEALPALTQALTHRDRMTCFQALDALQLYAPIPREVVAQICRLAAGTNDDLASAAASTLAYSGTNVDLAVPALVGALGRSAERGVRGNAAMALSQIGTPARSAVPALETVLQGSTGTVQVAASLALWKIAGRLEAVPILTARVRDPGTWDPLERLNRESSLKFFVATLGNIGPPAAAALPALRQAAEHAHPAVRQACQTAIAAIESKPTEIPREEQRR